MDKIISGLEPALQKLSEIFCVSVDAIRENGMQYILMYGRYEWIQSTITAICLVFVVWGIIFTGVCITHFGTSEDVFTFTYIQGDYDDAAEKDKELKKDKAFKKLVSILIRLLIASALIAIIASSIVYFACPEMYSINAAMDLLQSN